MFMEHLNEAQRNQLIVLAHGLTMADGEDAQDEEIALAALKEEAGFVGQVDMDAVLAGADTSVFDHPAARKAAMLQILVLAFEDEVLHEEESKFLGRVAGAFDFSQDQFNPMVEWAYRYGAAKRKGDAAAKEALYREGQAMIGQGG